MSNFKRKITLEQAQKLLDHYLEHGAEATEPLCAELGVSPRYPASMASVYGKRRPKYRKGTKYKNQPPQKCLSQDWNDPRWQWAIERGPVIA